MKNIFLLTNLLLCLAATAAAETTADCGSESANQTQQSLIVKLSREIQSLMPVPPEGWHITQNNFEVQAESYCASAPRITYSWQMESPSTLLMSLNKMQQHSTTSAQLNTQEGRELQGLLDQNFILMKPYIKALEQNELDRAHEHQAEIVQIRQKMDQIYAQADKRMLLKTEAYLPKDSRLSIQIILNEPYVVLNQASPVPMDNLERVYFLNDAKRVGISDWREPALVALLGTWQSEGTGQKIALVNQINHGTQSNINNVIVSIRGSENRAHQTLRALNLQLLKQLM
jgi:hypothetical protein